MRVAGCFRAVRRRDRVFSGQAPKPLSPKGAGLDVMVFRHGRGRTPLLLVAAPRRSGGAVERNRFRRRVRMVFLAALRKRGEPRGGIALWVRPAKGAPSGCRLCYVDIERQIESSLDRMGHIAIPAGDGAMPRRRLGCTESAGDGFSGARLSSEGGGRSQKLQGTTPTDGGNAINDQ